MKCPKCGKKIKEKYLFNNNYHCEYCDAKIDQPVDIIGENISTIRKPKIKSARKTLKSQYTIIGAVVVLILMIMVLIIKNY